MPDVLIFDDDPNIGNLATDILREKGLSVQYFQSGAGVLQMIEQGKPRMVILDIMMPGMDGLSACRAIRSNPVTRGVKIVVMTAKTFQKDRDTARQYGADLFVDKPFEPGAFLRSVAGILQIAPSLESGPATPAPPTQVTLLPAGATLQVGDVWVIFDAGRGLTEWSAGQKPPPLCWVLLSRYDPSCLFDLGAGGVWLAAGSRVNLAGPDTPDAPLQLLGPRMSRGAARTPLLYPMREAPMQLAPGIQASAIYTHHPGHTLAYRVEMQGRRVVYCPAHSIDRQRVPWNGHEMNKFRAFFQDADILLFGYRRSETQSVPADELGSAAWEPAVDLASESRVKKMVLFPIPGAPTIANLASLAEQRLRLKNAKLACEAGFAGQKFIL